MSMLQTMGQIWVQNGFEEKLSFLPIALDSCLIKLALALFRVQIRGASGAANLGSGLPKLNNSVVSRRWTKCDRTCVTTSEMHLMIFLLLGWSRGW